MRGLLIASTSMCLALAGCGGETAAEQSSPETPSGTESQAKAQLPSCPFQEIHELRGSIEGGRLLVTGRVDFMMAGFKPQLTERPGAAGVALDLALVPDSQAGVSDTLRYIRNGVGRSSTGEIWCGGERLATFDITLVG